MPLAQGKWKVTLQSNWEAYFKGSLCALLKSLTIICVLSFKRLMFWDYHLKNPVETLVTDSLHLHIQT